ncbi:MAG: putative thioredoxin [Rhodobacteraceae bacterium HLUCCA08]|nr:MAG: putative thioredoxin [Rhodobacteraceae bacterium HLUCCA08]
MRKTLILIAAAILGLAGGLYLALGRDASAPATAVDIAALEALRDDSMAKLSFGAARGSEVEFTSAEGDPMTLAAYDGQVVVLNFWATWCAPCRVEMPHLSELQAELGGDDFQVVTVAMGQNARPAMERFLAEIGVDNLPLHTDPRQALGRDMGIMLLPATLILDRDGNEIARMQGEADWASDSAKAIVRALIDG